MLGGTVSTVGGLPVAFQWAERWGCECIQTYLTLSRTWTIKQLTEEEVAAFRTAWRKSPVKEILAHVPYLVNLAAPDGEIRKKSLKRLEIEIARAVRFGVRLMALHPGSGGEMDRKKALRLVSRGLNNIYAKLGNPPVKLLLENMAGQGSVLGWRFEELAEILGELNHPQSFGVCFDTGHTFMAGYDFRGYEGYAKVMAEFDRIVGLEKIGAFHLNDSKTAFGSRVDRHTWMGKGHMGLQVFHALMRDERFKHTPMLLEIPERLERTSDNLKLLHRLQLRTRPIKEMPGVIA